MVPSVTLSITSPAVLTTKMSPRPWSNTISGGTLESEQVTITANGCWEVTNSARRSTIDWSGWIVFPDTNLALPSIKFFIARSAVIPEFSSDAMATSVQTKINKLIIKDVKLLMLIPPLFPVIGIIKLIKLLSWKRLSQTLRRRTPLQAAGHVPADA